MNYSHAQPKVDHQGTFGRLMIGVILAGIIAVHGARGVITGELPVFMWDGRVMGLLAVAYGLIGMSLGGLVHVAAFRDKPHRYLTMMRLISGVAGVGGGYIVASWFLG